MTKMMRTCQDESDESKDPVAEPKHQTWEDDVSNVGRDMLQLDRLLLGGSDKHNLLKITCEY